MKFNKVAVLQPDEKFKVYDSNQILIFFIEKDEKENFYEDRIFCPNCKKAKLFFNDRKSCPHFKKYPLSDHSDSCCFTNIENESFGKTDKSDPLEKDIISKINNIFSKISKSSLIDEIDENKDSQKQKEMKEKQFTGDTDNMGKYTSVPVRKIVRVSSDDYEEFKVFYGEVKARFVAETNNLYYIKVLNDDTVIFSIVLNINEKLNLPEDIQSKFESLYHSSIYSICMVVAGKIELTVKKKLKEGDKYKDIKLHNNKYLKIKFLSD